MFCNWRNPSNISAFCCVYWVEEVKNMCNCNCRFNCTLTAIITAVIAGVIAAFLQISGLITVTATALAVALGIGVVYLAVSALVAVIAGRTATRPLCLCRNLNTLLVGVLGTILVSLILLAVGITATSLLSAILVGLLVAFLWLTFAAAACLTRCAADCD